MRRLPTLPRPSPRRLLAMASPAAWPALALAALPALALAAGEGGHGSGPGGGGGPPPPSVGAWLDFLWQPKFVSMLAIAAVVLALLLTRRMSKPIKVGLLLLSTFLFGLAANLPIDFLERFGMHPSPICAFTKWMGRGLRTPFLITMGVIGFLTLVGPKLFCGWICPVGAAQELVSMLSDRLRIGMWRLPFRVTNTVRVAFALAFVVLSVGGLVAGSIYDHVNPFHGFEIGMPESFGGFLAGYLPLLLTLALAFKLYRPFCHLLCPVGLVANVLEQTGLVRVSLDRDGCIDCVVCSRESRCMALPAVLAEAETRPDCYACDRCVTDCPKSAVVYGLTRRVGKRYERVG